MIPAKSSLGGELSSFFLRALGVLFATLLCLPALAAPTPVKGANPVATEIERFFANVPAKLDGEEVDIQALRGFYQERRWQPAWTGQEAGIEPVLAAANLDGLPTRPFHLKAIRARLAAIPSAAAQAEADILVSDAILGYAKAMRGQRVQPRLVDEDWLLATPSFDAQAFLRRSVRDGAAALQGLVPAFAGYHALRGEMGRLLAVAAAGDWPKVPAGTSLRPGDVDEERIPAIRRRLIATGELAADADALGGTYDETLEAAVKLFQQRHGLNDDGVIGRQSVTAMNTTAAQRARQVALNMERWRWLPARLGDPHIVVNVPGQHFELVEEGRVTLAMRTVVGDPEHPTPALTSKLTSLVLNPVWRVPSSIATKEILPRLKKNPGYLIANDLELVSDGFAPGSPESQGIGIDWKSLSSMPWPVRQRSGSDNALGLIKFNIPNGEDIYLHDTPAKRDFAKARRALSHGCIRLERPEDLAFYLLGGQGWTEERLKEAIGSGETRSVQVTKQIPVWLLYWTAWVDEGGVLQIRDDVYGRDHRLAQALAGSAPRAATRGVAAQAAPLPIKQVCDGCRIP